MTSKEIAVGKTYMMKVSGQMVPVRIDKECEPKTTYLDRGLRGGEHGGWHGTNMVTKRQVHIRTAAKLLKRITP